MAAADRVDLVGRVKTDGVGRRPGRAEPGATIVRRGEAAAFRR